MSIIKKGDWIQIEETVLRAGERAPQVPEDTQHCDLKMWVKGIAETEGDLEEEIEIATVTGRRAKGKAVALNPRYIHNYGEFQPELLKIEMQLKHIMEGGEK